MAYQTIPALAATDVIDASHLNILADNADFLYAVMSRQNWPCASISNEAIAGFDETNSVYRIRHRLPILKWRVETNGTLDYIRIMYNGIHVDGEETPTGTVITGNVDLTNITAWMGYQGAWVISTAYDKDAGNTDIVAHSGAYYRCIADHTSSAADEPGVGANWETYWQVITIPTIGTMYDVVADVSASGTPMVMVAYLMETQTA